MKADDLRDLYQRTLEKLADVAVHSSVTAQRFGLVVRKDAQEAFERAEQRYAQAGGFRRTPAGFVNNCSLANGEPMASCQICGGNCPDKDDPRLAPPPRLA